MCTFNSVFVALVQISIEPSNNVQENDTVKIRCLLSTGKHIAQFNLPDGISCIVVFQNNTCSEFCEKSVICENSETFSLQTKAQRIWNNKTIFCEEFGGGERSEAITFNIKGKLVETIENEKYITNKKQKKKIHKRTYLHMHNY